MDRQRQNPRQARRGDSPDAAARRRAHRRGQDHSRGPLLRRDRRRRRVGRRRPRARRCSARSRRNRPAITTAAETDHRSGDGDRRGRGHLAHAEPRAILPFHSGRRRRDLDTGHGPRRRAVSEPLHAARVRGPAR